VSDFEHTHRRKCVLIVPLVLHQDLLNKIFHVHDSHLLNRKPKPKENHSASVVVHVAVARLRRDGRVREKQLSQEAVLNIDKTGLYNNGEKR
jgi:hypothetical protein